MLITVFTPTYNRAPILHRVYDSLLSQNHKNFEWVIVDDGSIDNTREVVEKWRAEAPFPVYYFFQENKGKHGAINLGVKNAHGELFLIADSDDEFTPDTIGCFTETWSGLSAEMQQKAGGIWCLCLDEEHHRIGTEFPSSPYHTLYGDFVYRYKNVGEKWHIERTDLMRRYPFPDVRIPYFPESLVWKKIYREHLMVCINNPLRIYYQTPGSIMNGGVKWDGVLFETKAVLNEDGIYFSKNPFAFIKTCLLYCIAANMQQVSFRKAVTAIRPAGFKFIVACSYFAAYFYTRFKLKG